MLSGNPYISTINATANDENAPIAFQSRRPPHARSVADYGTSVGRRNIHPSRNHNPGRTRM